MRTLLIAALPLAYLAGEVDFPTLEDRIADSLSPCMENYVDASFHIAISRSWQHLMPEYDPVNQPNAIPVGLYQGDIVPGSCFAVEDFSGRVTFYERPYQNGTLNPTIPFFTPHPRMESFRDSQKG